MQRHFTASAYILDADKVLLLYHRKLQKWLPPGGHVEENELPCETAKREVLEETGFEIEIISEENIWIEQWNAQSMPRPYLCLLEKIPAHGSQPFHEHIDFVYLGRIIRESLKGSLQEVNEVRWFRLAEIESLRSDIDIFTETQQVLRALMAEVPATAAAKRS